MPELPAVFLHAELLPNVRQLTLHVSLPNSPSDIDIRESSITLSESRRAITVFTTYGNNDAKHELVETLKLPVRVTDASRRNLSFAGHRVDTSTTTSGDAQNNQTAEYSFRLQVDAHDIDLVTTKQGLQEDEYVPWTANDMSTCVSLHCRFCKELIIDALKESDVATWQWKDLPSANWAEMMDFWHCHKPDVHVDAKEQQKAIEDQTASVKGYGASNRVVANPRTVLVDVASFLVAKSDCHNIKTSIVMEYHTIGYKRRRLRRSSHDEVTDTNAQYERPYYLFPKHISLYKEEVLQSCSQILQKRPTGNSPTKSTLLHEEQKAKNIACSECGAILGMEDPVAEGLRLYKNNFSARQLATGSAEEPVYETYGVDVITSAQLLDLVDHEGVRRFVIHAGQSDGILLWAFNPDLRYSSSSADHSIVSKRAMKVLYQNVSDVEGILEPDNGAPAPLSLEELFLPENIYDELAQALQYSNRLLPVSARTFREWNVALLGRLERDA
ncbi:hypothetical protein UA08_07283 [Talaromyces atroroseus]|uniref:Ubiquitin-conjugating enzyme E2C-binding protein n=1 Tax=Talaromyces atroroseus TaxID=1441469 RepID=A0A225AKR9_TALAT|nr:hypothetical protein UA08_07283 [Talaromyces atroroseus]OKL57828.1 hypothetical protein UA08_07283 [Talaromyces atroroseus]